MCLQRALFPLPEVCHRYSVKEKKQPFSLYLRWMLLAALEAFVAGKTCPPCLGTERSLPRRRWCLSPSHLSAFLLLTTVSLGLDCPLPLEVFIIKPFTSQSHCSRLQCCRRVRTECGSARPAVSSLGMFSQVVRAGRNRICSDLTVSLASTRASGSFLAFGNSRRGFVSCREGDLFHLILQTQMTHHLGLSQH